MYLLSNCYFLSHLSHYYLSLQSYKYQFIAMPFTVTNTNNMRQLIYLLSLTTYLYHPIQTYSITSNENNVTELLEYVLLDGENKHPCARICTKNSSPMVCRYHFLLEWYQTMSKACYDCPFLGEDCDREHCIPGDGRKRPVLVVNRRMPGPSIEVS